MKTFLLVLLILVAVVLAVKLLPFLFALICICGAGVAVMALVGLSLAAGLLCAGMVLALLLSPIWLPVLAIVGVIALIKKLSAKPVAA